VSESTHRERIRTDNPATTRVNQPGREEAVVRAGETPIEHERPEEWGWHGHMGKWGRRLLVLPLIFLIAMNFGNQRGHIENAWLIGITVVVVLIAVWDWRRRKNAWRAE
jgi:Protein of unknown function (DUF2631)